MQPAPSAMLEGALAVRSAFCASCNRDVHLSERDPLACPVCSSPLIERVSEPEGSASRMTATPILMPEIYLG